MKFYDRDYELEELERIWKLSRKNLHLTIISGRRRVGKTELVKRFCSGKEHLYFFIGRKKMSLLMEELSGITKNRIEYFPTMIKFDEWLEFLLNNVKEGTVLFFDEFQNFKYIDESVFSDFQKVYDKHKSRLKIHIIAAGSHVTMMDRIFSDSKEPLFGRATEKYVLKPLPFVNVREMLSEIGVTDMREQINWYAVFGGMPKYYVIAEEQGLRSKDIFFGLKLLLLRDFAPLGEEVKSVLSEEFGSEHPSYFSILEAVALGNSEMTTIANKSGINIKSISKYLGLLSRELGYLDYEVPVTEEKPWKSKKGRYFLSDNFLRFWFRHIYRNRSEYEIGNYDAIMARIRKDFGILAGREFERISKELLMKMSREKKNLFEFTKVGRWWHRGEEIDVVALNDQGGEILFAECKWQDNVDAGKVFSDLREKAKHVQWNNGNRKEHYAVFAKSFRERVKEPNLVLFDLKDMERVMRV